MKVFSLLLVLCASLTLGAQIPEVPVNGTITGTIFDATNGRPIPLVQVEVDGMSDGRMTTDTNGRFTISLKPGIYKLRFSNANYVETTIDEVEVTAGKTTEASTVMPNKRSVTAVDVVEKIGAIASTAESMLTERRLSGSVSDSISKEEIRNAAASDAAGALEKVTGVSVVDNGYVYVRGLGERYSATMLNNAMIPTTEPERRVVPLDLFPSSLIDNIKIQKTYSVDLPGEFSGGLVQMQTVEFPTEKTFAVTVNYGFNSQTTGKLFRTYPGGGLDGVGFDDGGRGLPGIFPEDKRLFVGNFTDQEFQEFGRALSNNYTPVNRGWTRPQQTYSISGGNTYGKLGLVGAITFANQPQRYPEERRFLVNAGGGQPQIFSDYSQFNSTNEGIRLGGVMNASLRLNPANKLVFRNTLTRDTDKEVREFQGLNGGIGVEIQDTRLRWTERRLISTGLEGEHALAKFGNSIFRWQFTYSDSYRGEPDLRESIRGREPGTTGPFAFLNLGDSGTRYFSNLYDKIYEPQVEWGTPFFKGAISGIWKVGFRGTIRRRDFEARRFRFFPVRTGTIDFYAPTNDILSDKNIRPDGFVLREFTRGTDKYQAEMDVYGGYGMLDLNLGSRWRLIGGIRIEDAAISVLTQDPLVPNSIPQAAVLNNRDPLPAVNAIYALTPRQNLRFGYGRTLNRPDFRELSPFEFTNVVGGYTTVGNPNLRRATIDNFDARWEWFLGGNQILAASYFYKKFKDPIEQIYRPTASELRQSFSNVAGANNQGIELEFRKNLGSFHRKLDDFALQSNLTFVNSDVVIPDEPEYLQLTSKSRPLVGQSRFIYNIVGEWMKPKWRSNVRIYMNSVSRRISDVGTFQLPDIYQERMTFLDVVYQLSLRSDNRWTMRFSAENLTDNHYRYTQSEFLVRGFRLGRTYTIGTTYSFF